MIFKHCDKQSLRNCMKTMKSQLPYSKISSSKTYLKLSLKWRSRRCAHDWSAFLRKLRHWSLRSTAATASSTRQCAAPPKTWSRRVLRFYEVKLLFTSVLLLLVDSRPRFSKGRVLKFRSEWEFENFAHTLNSQPWEQVVMAQLLSSSSVHKVRRKKNFEYFSL